MLDITAEVCPMSFVRTRLALDQLPSGAILRVRLRGAETARSVPQQAQNLGHTIIAMETEESDIVTVTIRRK